VNGDFCLSIAGCQHFIRLRLAHGEAAVLFSVVRQNEVAHPQRLPKPGPIRRVVWVRRWACGLRVLRAILPKWFLPTRLETRTKESNKYASVLVQKPTRVMRVIDATTTAASTDHAPLEKGLSMSISVRTRKMVNYAWVG